MKNLIEDIGRISYPLESDEDLEPLMEAVDDSKVVLIGEASHGTHEFYTWRAALTKRLISEKGFNFVAVEGDWPDCYEVNRYLKHFDNSPSNARELLQIFKRWPTWMWANEEVEEFVEWLRDFNKTEELKAGFYGLDVYSLWDSLEKVIQYLREHDPESLGTAEEAYKCLQPFGKNPQSYAIATSYSRDNCSDEILNMLSALKINSIKYNEDKENMLNLERNAMLVRNAEHYYRSMMFGNDYSWNVRDQHMAETFDAIMNFYGKGAKGIVWAHNTHVGDARYTDMSERGMINVGELARSIYKDKCFIVGFGSYRGELIAAENWGDPMKVMKLPDAKSGSLEDLLHNVSASDKIIIFDDASERNPDLFEMIRQRAVGVIYDPDFESGNYVPTIFPRRYDAFIHIDETEAVRPLIVGYTETNEPETYPSTY